MIQGGGDRAAEQAQGGEEYKPQGEDGEGEVEEEEEEEEDEGDEEEGAAVLWRKALAATLGRPYGPACLTEVLHFLCSLLTLEEHHFGALACGLSGQEEDLPMFALQLITSALHAAGPLVELHPRLLALVSDDLFRSLFALHHSPNPHIFPLICSLALHLFLTLRPHLKLQLEAFFVLILGKAARGRHSQSHPHSHHQEALESLLDFFSLPEFAVEVYGNYDCDIARTNLLEDLAGILSKAAFPLHTRLASTHIIALRALLQALSFMARRVDQGAPPRPPPPPSSVRQLEGPEFWTCQWGTVTAGGEEDGW